ncbi:Calcium/calmodulin-dependent 3',5'-cyclic nucleotide phosphodiesterase 1 [Frankliniella fusca]|uniref:Phosphodiesterase n=1 Tax=Frankliniella fusca TaxID=407009 RepID=A0AAE1H8L1_9NEOP|nr:Calcium/calmodulin-dependent 3',5'-cyclic nucleotide phosphodiesterase 1 [Frankliniella fusca]
MFVCLILSVAEQGSLTIVRRSSTKKAVNNNPVVPTVIRGGAPGPPGAPPDDTLARDLECMDLTTECLPPVDTPDACDKAAFRLRCLLRQLQLGQVSADLLQSNLLYAARVLEAVFIDETKDRADEGPGRPGHLSERINSSESKPVQRRRLRRPVWARGPASRGNLEASRDGSPPADTRRLADEDDELSEVQPDAVPPEVREWLASTFTRQLATQRRRPDEKPKFRSVAHAIRAGIFVDRIYRRVSNAALMQFPPEVVRVLKTLDDWSFDVFALNEAASGQPIKYLGYDLLNRYGIIHKFKVPPTVLETLLGRIEEGYSRHKNPYHNNLHAADVAQGVHYMLCQTGLMNWLTDLEIFATLLAAIVHDFEHTGTTNNFHVMSGSDTALLYNDRAVLENHHISAAFRALREDECNILQNLSREEFREFRTLVIDMVLATDMSFHFQQLKNMRNTLSLAEPTVDKSKALAMVLHCCDIAHPAKRWDLHHRWTELLLEEFFRQGDRERELGLPFSPLCDRNNTLVAESQIGFIEFIVEPSMGVCADMLEAVLAPILGKSTTDTSANKEAIEEEPACDQKHKSEQRFTIKKPWVAILAENKKQWKEQAAKDAELRALQQQTEEMTGGNLSASVEEE